MSSSRQRNRGVGRQNQQSMDHQPHGQQSNPQQSYIKQQSLAQPWNVQPQALTQNQQQFVHATPGTTQMIDPQGNNQTFLYHPQASCSQTNNTSTQTVSVETTTTTTNTTDQTAHASQYNPPNISQQPMQQAAQYNIQQYNYAVPYSGQQPAQRPAYQAGQDTGIQQQSFDYTQLAQVLPAQQSFDYTQLASAPPVALGQSVTSSSATAVQRTTTNREERNAEREERRRQRVAMQDQMTASSGSNSIITTRQAAEARGGAELLQFHEKVSQMLLYAGSYACPVGFGWSPERGGYRCFGGNHFVSDESINNMVTYGTPPDIQLIPRSLGMGSFGLLRHGYFN